EHFHPAHAVAVVLAAGDGAVVGWLPEAGPAAAGIILVVRGEELRAAADAMVAAGDLAVVVGTAERRLGTLPARDLELAFVQQGAPFLRCFLHLIAHASSSLSAAVRCLTGCRRTVFTRLSLICTISTG